MSSSSGSGSGALTTATGLAPPEATGAAAAAAGAAPPEGTEAKDLEPVAIISARSLPFNSETTCIK